MIHPSFAEYLWIDGFTQNQHIRSTCRVMKLPENPGVKDFDIWQFDGSSTGQSSSNAYECTLKPARIYRDPFRGEGHYIVLCEVHDTAGNAHDSNYRSLLRAAIRAAGQDVAPQFGYEQTYTLLRSREQVASSEPPQKASYCGAGFSQVFGREVAQAHANACIHAGVHFEGMNAEEKPGQWRFQVGPCDTHDALRAADDIWLARYLLNIVGEQFGVEVSIDPRSTDIPSNQDRLIATFSTAFTRDPRCGTTAINAIVAKLENDTIETPDPGIQNQIEKRIHIPSSVVQRGYGHLVDRHPTAYNDPYRIANNLISTVLQDEEKLSIGMRC